MVDIKDLGPSPVLFRSFASREEAEQHEHPNLVGLKREVVEMEASSTSPALRGKSPEYSPEYNGRVPKKVKMLCTVYQGDSLLWAARNEGIYDAWVDIYGAVSAVLENGTLVSLGSIEPRAFEVVGWHDGNEDN
jgi:hypothetical protein